MKLQSHEQGPELSHLISSVLSNHVYESSGLQHLQMYHALLVIVHVPSTMQFRYVASNKHNKGFSTDLRMTFNLPKPLIYLSIRLDTVKVVTSLLDVCSKLLRWSRWSSAVVTDKNPTTGFQPFVETAE